jgi:methylthioribose-1-phosphate isomerase
MKSGLIDIKPDTRPDAAMRMAMNICERDVQINESIGRHGLELLRSLAPDTGSLNILTHCNAGWLATVDWGTVTAPIYAAHAEDMPVHVWVDETRPRIQGALTAWELAHAGVAHTYITDNAGGHLMQHGKVDVCIVGTDRTTASGDVANKIGTYLKALAARDNDIPFYVALPSSTIDWNLHEGKEIPIEERDSREVTTIRGRTDNDRDETIRIVSEGTPAANYGFDVTPARLVTGLITERGIVRATREDLARLFPEAAENADEKRRHG